MKQFIYTARDVSGKMLKGVSEGANRQDVVRTISAKGYLVVDIKEASKTGDIFAKKMSLDSIIAFTQKIKVLLDAGISLLDGLRLLWEQTENEHMQLIISEIRTLLSRGIPLAGALKRFPYAFSKIYISLIAVGEKGGVLSFVLDKISEHLSRQKETIAKFKKALIYPMLVLGLASAAVIGMFVFIIPMFKKIFLKMKIELPLITRILVNISEIFIKFWWIGVLFSVIVVIGYRYFSRTKKGKYLIDKHTLRIPVVGRIFFYLSLSRFLHTFSVLLQSGVPLIESIDDTLNSMGNSFMIERLSVIKHYLSSGLSLKDSLSKVKMLPPFVLGLIGIGEESGSLPKSIDITAGMVDEDVDYQLDKLTTLLGPIAIMVVGVFVLIVLLAVYSPIFALWGGLQK